MTQFTSIEVVLKISERCNINCSYCYMFNQANTEYAGRPAYMNGDTLLEVAGFLRKAVLEHQTEDMHVIFHGGEPMMMKPDRFDEICRVLDDQLGMQVNLRFSMQTNAMLVSDTWISLLIKYDIGVGVSIDGPPLVHDLDRLDHKGVGTYEAVVAGLKKLQAVAASGLLKPVGSLAVIRPSCSGREVFDHLSNELGMRTMNFLLPIETHDTWQPIKTQDQYGDYMTGVYEGWLAKGDSGIRVRFINEAINFLSGGSEGVVRRRQLAADFALFVVGSGGELEPDDALKPLIDSPIERKNVRTTSLAGFLDSPEMKEISAAFATLPSDCTECEWQNGCRGSAGRLVNRYSKSRGFNNKSIICDSLKRFYGVVSKSLITSGTSEERILEAMCAEPLPECLTTPVKHPSVIHIFAHG